MDASSSKRIAIFIYQYGLGNSPALINTGKILARYGYLVDYFTFNTFIGNFDFHDASIRIIPLSEKEITDRKASASFSNTIPLFIRSRLGYLVSGLYRVKEILLDRMFSSQRIVSLKRSLTEAIDAYVKRADGIIGASRYSCFIGAEPGGLIAASILGDKHKVPVVYYSLELWLSDEITMLRDKVLKDMEKKYNKSAAFTITLDEERSVLLAHGNGIPLSSIVTVPVCADGPKYGQKGDFFRKKFKLPERARIILYAGFIAEWAMCEEMARAALGWPQNRILVLHTHGYNEQSYLEKISKYEGAQVKISREPVSYEELPSLLASADIGIALYRDLGKNFNLLGSASGKLSHYLKSGLPVIANNYPSIREIINRYNCGICIDDVSQIAGAVEKIINNYDVMHQNAFVCYEDNYMLSKHFNKVLERLKNL